MRHAVALLSDAATGGDWYQLALAALNVFQAVALAVIGALVATRRDGGAERSSRRGVTPASDEERSAADTSGST